MQAWERAAEAVKKYGSYLDALEASKRVVGDDAGKRYANGGVVDYTGMAYVDGTKSKPELMLNNRDVAKVYEAIHTSDSLTQDLRNAGYRMISLSDYMMQRFGRVIEDLSPLTSLSANVSRIPGKIGSADIPHDIVASANSATVVERIDVPVSVLVTEKLDEQDIRKFSRVISDIASSSLRDAFETRGIKNIGSERSRIRI